MPNRNNKTERRDDEFVERPYTNREIDAKLEKQTDEIKGHISTSIAPLVIEIKSNNEKVTYTNGKVKKITVFLIIIASVVVTLLIVNGSEFANFALKLI